MNKKRLRDISIQYKISSIYIATNLLILAVNVVLLLNINSMSNSLDMVYQDNLHLDAVMKALENVQDDMTRYLNSKTTDSLEDYYRSESAFVTQIDGLNADITGVLFERMERNIKNMSQDYLSEVRQAVEAKRGRNVEKYRVHYEEAARTYGYIITCITSLNTEKFRSNSEQYADLLRRFRLFEFISLAAMIVVMACNVGIIMGFVGAAVRPLRELAGSAEEVARGNFEIEELPVTSEDEVGKVTGAFNQMVVSIRRYIEQLRERMETERVMKERELMMETHLKDARLKYLQAQINPHFLFNTLNAGAQLAMMEGADHTYDYIQKVAQFYRYNIKKTEDTVTVADEIEMVDSYIYILNVRFAGDIRYEKNVDEAYLAFEMPGMILQPIVENCINHGIHEMGDRGRIILSVYGLKDGVCISVEDNGVGMSRTDIEKLLNGSYRNEDMSADKNGIGMDNVISRLRLFTGREDVIDIKSDGRGCGTRVLLYLRKKESEQDV